MERTLTFVRSLEEFVSQRTPAELVEGLGVGFFSGRFENLNTPGITLHASPSFLTKNLEQAIIQGFVAFCEEEPVLIQSEQYGGFPWLMVGLHDSLLHADVQSIKKAHSFFAHAENYSDLCQRLYQNICMRIEQVRPAWVFVSSDLSYLTNFLKAACHFLGFEDKNVHKAPVEFLYYLIEQFTHPRLFIEHSYPEEAYMIAKGAAGSRLNIQIDVAQNLRSKS